MQKKVVSCALVLQALCARVPAAQATTNSPDPSPSAQTSVSATGLHEQALTAARRQDYASALPLLEKLCHDYPQTHLYRYDALAVASWAGQPAKAIALAKGLLVENMPDYALSALARAQRDAHEYDKAIKLYRLQESRIPPRADPLVGHIQTLLDAKRLVEAEVLARSALLAWPENADVLSAAERAYALRGNWIGALDLAQHMLEKAPNCRNAKQLRFDALHQLGAPHIAETYAPQQEKQRMAALHQEQLAFEQRWARVEIERLDTPARWSEIDQVIAKGERLAKTLETDPALQSLQGPLQYDLISALTDRLRMREAITRFETSEGHYGKAPDYARAAYGQALLYQEQPERAADILATVLNNDRYADVKLRLAYFYALIEAQRYDEAIKYIDAQNDPQWKFAWSATLRQENEDFLSLRIAQAQARAYTERLAEGQARLEALSQRAPASNDIASALSETYQMRGWNRKAEALQQWVLGASPDYAWAELGLFNARMALDDYRLAETDLKSASSALPEEKAITKARRQWESYQMREFRFEMESGRSDDSGINSIGNRERTANAWLYSAPIDYAWRMFAHSHYSSANFTDATPIRIANGIGGEYRQRDWLMSAEIYALNHQGTGEELNLVYHPSDAWEFNAELADKSLQAPIRAYADDINVRSLSLGSSYRWHESRSAHISAEVQNFSDGNQRHEYSAYGQERIISGPRYKLDLRGDVSFSDNTLASSQTSYFNPSRDRSLGLALINEWTQMHRYEQSLKHRLEIGLGSYWQDSYGSNGFTSLHYELAYTPSDRQEFRLGLTHTRRPYDGVETRADAINLSVNWRF